MAYLVMHSHHDAALVLLGVAGATDMVSKYTESVIAEFASH